MSETLVRSVVREVAESNRPSDMDLWPAIRDKVPPGFLEHRTASLSRFVATESSQSPITTASRVGRTTAILSTYRSRVNMAMVLVALVALAAISITFITGDRFQVASQQSAESAFLSPGKVRHMIYTGTYTVGGGQPTEVHREEFWLTEGKNHPLMRNMVTVPITTMIWLDDNAYYEYEPGKGNQVRKYPYDSKYLAAVVPDPKIISKTLQMQNARLVGDDTLDGRPVVVIAVASSNAPTPPNPTPPAEAGSSYTATTVTYWIDRETNQILQISGVDTTVGGPQDGLVKAKTVNKIALNELMDRSELAADFFDFKLPSGATLAEGEPVLSTPTP